MKRTLVAALVILVTASAAWAIDVQNIQPAMGPQNLFSLYVSDPLAAGQFALGLLVNNAAGPLRFEFDNGDNLNVVDRLSAVQFYGAVGLFNAIDLMAGGSYNSVFGEDLDSVNISDLPETDNTSGAGIGDFFAGLKWRILYNEPGSLGLAFVVIGSFGAGNEDFYVGAGATNFSGAVVLDKRVSMVNFVLNAGYRYMGQPENLEPSGQTFGGFGVDVAVTEWFGVTGEFVGKTVDYGIGGVDSTTPLEALAGVRFYTPVGLSFTLGGGLGLTSAIGDPTYRVMAGVSFSYPRLEYGPPAAEAVPHTLPVGPSVAPQEAPSVDTYVDQDGVSHEVVARRPGGVLMLRDLFVLPQPLAFTGPQSATLTEQDRAMLDQVAEVLREYPRVKIQIEGHVSSNISDAQRLTQQRAEAVLNYLRGRGVDASRMLALGMGADVPIASNNTAEGRRKNTRIDILITEQ